MVKNIIDISISTENPFEHWQFIECSEDVVIDLGCGRWEKIELRDPSWPTTPEFLVSKGAKNVYAIDNDPDEISWFNQHLNDSTQITPICMNISTTDDLINIYKEYRPKVVKSDIEGFEKLFLSLPDEYFNSVNFYAVETHSKELYNKFIEQFERLNYSIVATINLLHASPMKVIFARKT